MIQQWMLLLAVLIACLCTSPALAAPIHDAALKGDMAQIKALLSVVGGLGTLVGPFVGASFVHYLNDFLGEHTERAILVIGLFFIITILPAPRGIVGSLIQVWRVQASTGNEE